MYKNRKNIKNVICVCSRKDAATFEVASEYITRYIMAENYRVIVPEKDIYYFEECVDKKFEIVSENIYLEIILYLKKKSPENYERFGWYLQQFLKISEIMRGDKGDINLIWDADTIPIKYITFHSGEKILYYKGKGFHTPYFSLLQRLFEITPRAPYSFIAQSFPTKVEWVNDFVELLEKKHHKKWYEAIIDRIDFSEGAGFSEYETLGNFQWAHYRDYMNFTSRSWMRHGARIIGEARDVDKYYKGLGKKYDFVAFEAIDRKKTGIKYRLYRFIIRYIWPFLNSEMERKKK